jgi:hypothetical protein
MHKQDYEHSPRPHCVCNRVLVSEMQHSKFSKPSLARASVIVPYKSSHPNECNDLGSKTSVHCRLAIVLVEFANAAYNDVCGVGLLLRTWGYSGIVSRPSGNKSIISRHIIS